MKLTRMNVIIGLLALLGFQIILLIFLNIFSKQNIKSRSFDKPLISGVKKDQIISMEISDYKDSFIIEKNNNSWILKIKDKELPGNTSKIDSYIDSLIKINLGKIRDKGSDASSDALYGFDNLSSQKLLIKTANKKDITLFIGHAGSMRGTSYIRFNNEKKIREVNSYISSETSTDPFQWVKKTVFEGIAEQDVDKCTITSSMDWYKGTYVIKYKEQKTENKDNKQNTDNFILEQPSFDKPVKPYVLQSMVQGIINLNVDRYKLEGDAKQGTKKATVSLALKNGKNYMLDIYKADKTDVGDYAVVTNLNNYQYLVNENEVKRFIKEKKDMTD